MDKSNPKFFDVAMLFLLGGVFIIYILMASFGPHDSLDARLYYSGNEARSLFESFGASELKAYFINEIFDLVLIVCYTAALYLGLRRLYSTSVRMTLIPLIAGGADFIETSAIISVLKFSLSPGVFDWLGVFTFIKWSFVGMALLLILIGWRPRSMRT